MLLQRQKWRRKKSKKGRFWLRRKENFLMIRVGPMCPMRVWAPSSQSCLSWNWMKFCTESFLCGVREMGSLDWELLHILFQLNHSTTLNSLLIFNETANGQGAPRSRKRNATEPRGSLLKDIRLWMTAIGNPYSASFKIPAQLWVPGRKQKYLLPRTHLCSRPCKEIQEKKPWKISLMGGKRRNLDESEERRDG